MMVVNRGDLHKIKEARHLVLMGGLMVINEGISYLHKVCSGNSLEMCPLISHICLINEAHYMNYLYWYTSLEHTYINSQPIF
jgi:hypothetical protein